MLLPHSGILWPFGEGPLDSYVLPLLFKGADFLQSPKIIHDWPIYLPPLSEQHEIVRRVESLFALADRIEQRVAIGQEKVDRLTQAILAKAFCGELVPTEAELARRERREYEPASVLLERI